MKKWTEKDLETAIKVKDGMLPASKAIDELNVDMCQLNSVISAFKSLEKNPKSKRASKLMKELWLKLKRH